MKLRELLNNISYYFYELRVALESKSFEQYAEFELLLQNIITLNLLDITVKQYVITGLILLSSLIMEIEVEVLKDKEFGIWRFIINILVILFLAYWMFILVKFGLGWALYYFF